MAKDPTPPAPPPVPAPPVPDESWRGAARAALVRPGSLAGLVAAVLPTGVFLAAGALASLTTAIAAAAATALLVFGWRLRRRGSLAQPLTGAALAGVCVATAALTGEARGFFLFGVTSSLVAGVVGLLSIAARRPLAGVLLHRVVGGRPGWQHEPRLLRTYTYATLACALVSFAEFALQIAVYLVNQPAVLAVVNILDPVMWSAITVGIVVTARRRVVTTARAAGAEHGSGTHGGSTGAVGEGAGGEEDAGARSEPAGAGRRHGR